MTDALLWTDDPAPRERVCALSDDEAGDQPEPEPSPQPAKSPPPRAPRSADRAPRSDPPPRRSRRGRAPEAAADGASKRRRKSAGFVEPAALFRSRSKSLSPRGADDFYAEKRSYFAEVDGFELQLTAEPEPGPSPSRAPRGGGGGAAGGAAGATPELRDQYEEYRRAVNGVCVPVSFAEFAERSDVFVKEGLVDGVL